MLFTRDTRLWVNVPIGAPIIPEVAIWIASIVRSDISATRIKISLNVNSCVCNDTRKKNDY
jgi:hypothetical protein